MERRSGERERERERESVCFSVCVYVLVCECMRFSLIKKNDKCLEEIETFVSENEVTFFV